MTNFKTTFRTNTHHGWGRCPEELSQRIETWIDENCTPIEWDDDNTTWGTNADIPDDFSEWLNDLTEN